MRDSLPRDKADKVESGGKGNVIIQKDTDTSIDGESNALNLKNMIAKRTLILSTRRRQLKFVGRIIRKEGLENSHSVYRRQFIGLAKWQVYVKEWLYKVWRPAKDTKNTIKDYKTYEIAEKFDRAFPELIRRLEEVASPTTNRFWIQS